MLEQEVCYSKERRWSSCTRPRRKRGLRLQLSLLVVLAMDLVLCTYGTVDVTKERSVCFNDCSGHGTCRDFVCQCDVGYHGGDCSFGKSWVSELIISCLTVFLVDMRRFITNIMCTSTVGRYSLYGQEHSDPQRRSYEHHIAQGVGLSSCGASYFTPWLLNTHMPQVYHSRDGV